MLNDELIQWCAAGHQHGRRNTAATAGAARALPGGSDASRIARHDTDFQAANIHAEFQRVCGYHPKNLTLAQTLLYFATLQRQVSTSVSTHQVTRKDVPFQSIL